MNNKPLIMIVEDEEGICNFISAILTSNEYNVIKTAKGKEAVSMAASYCPDLILLDLGLPDMDGVEVLKTIRQWSGIPVVVSARGHEREKVEALDFGADDYITKPFNPLEMVARVKAQLRRYTRYNTPNNSQNKIFKKPSEFDFCGLIINNDTHKCMLYGKQLSLTPIEFSVLWYLCENKGKVVSSEELFEAVWGEKYINNNNTVMAHMGRLREKMNETPRNPKFIKTVWGVGYQIEN